MTKKMFNFYGWKDEGREEIVQKLSNLMGVTFESRESSYIGEYELYEDDKGSAIQVLSDFEDENGSIYQFPGYKTFLDISGPMADKYEKGIIEMGGDKLKR